MLNFGLHEMLKKVLWATLNTFPPKAIRYKKALTACISDSTVLVILIDYDKFSDRTRKVVKSQSYHCGREGLKIIENYCVAVGIDCLNVITTDDPTSVSSSISDGNLRRLNNRGTDIAALADLSKLIENYTNVIVANSSLNVNEADLISRMHMELENYSSGQHFVIGCNGNSRLSPRLPLIGGRSPHVITNFFACPAADLISTLSVGGRSFLARFAGGYGNKYVAIRYFEILLSRNALRNRGDLVLLKNGRVRRYRDSQSDWPRKDSRFAG